MELSKIHYSCNLADDTIIFRLWLNYIDEKDWEANKWMKEEVHSESSEEEAGEVSVTT